MILDSALRLFAARGVTTTSTAAIAKAAGIADAVIQESARHLSYYFDAIQKGLAEGSIKPYPADLIGVFLYQDLVAVLNHTRRQVDSNHQEEAIQQGFQIFWNGIKSDPETRD